MRKLLEHDTKQNTHTKKHKINLIKIKGLQRS